jgi:uncharacterized protein YjbI with pentapeptide repeats
MSTTAGAAGDGWATRIVALLTKLSKNAERLIVIQTVILILQTLIILFPVYEYWSGGADRIRTKQFQAWQLIGTATGKVGDAGRSQALEDLNTEHVGLRGLEAPRAKLDGLRLPGADLKFAILQGASFVGGKFTRASVTRAELTGTWFARADLRRSDFTFSHADGASFRGGRACEALFIGSSLRGASFVDARLTGADFSGADLRGAMFPAWLDTTLYFRHANVASLEPAALRVWALRRGAVAINDSARWARYQEYIAGTLKNRWFFAERRIKNRWIALPECPSPNG